MKIDTLLNLIQGGLFALFGLSALIGAVFCGAWWHYFTATACGVFVRMFYTDEMYGTESVRSYFRRIRKKQ